jgi:hypothetical protein
MGIPVLIERVFGNGFRASGTIPFIYTVEGATRDEVVQKLEHLIANKLESGSELIDLAIPEQDNPWLKMAGMWDKDDPHVREWKEIMRENRLKDEENSDNP